MGHNSNLHDDHRIFKSHHHKYIYHVHHGDNKNGDDQEVFTDMSVLPLVFPDNMSCFSRGSYKVRLCFEEFVCFNVLVCGCGSYQVFFVLPRLRDIMVIGDINRCDDVDNLSGGARSEETVAGASDATEGAAGHRQVGGQRLR